MCGAPVSATPHELQSAAVATFVGIPSFEGRETAKWAKLRSRIQGLSIYFFIVQLFGCEKQS